MGNWIRNRVAANRQARINRRNNNCCPARVYYCHQPRIIHCQPVQRHSQPRIIHQESRVVQQEQSTPKPPKLELNFKGMQQNTINPQTNLGQWLQNKREDTEVNMFKVGDVHIMEVHGDSPTLQFFDNAGNKWQALSQKQTIEFYQEKEKQKNPKEENNMAGVVGNNPRQGVINDNQVNSNSGAGSSSDADSTSGANSGSTAGAGSSSRANGGGVTNIIDNSNRQSETKSGTGIDVYEKRNSDGSSERKLKLGDGQSLIQNAGSIQIGDITLFGNNNKGRQTSKGSSTLIGRDAKQNGAVGKNASNNGMSKKEKKQLRKMLNRNFKASLKAAELAQEAVDAAKKAAKSSKKSSENSEAAKTASEQTQEALANLPDKVKNEVRSAIKQLNKKLEDARTNFAADQSKANQEQLTEIQNFAKKYLSDLKKSAPDLAKRIAPLIKIDVPKAEVPEIKLDLKIEEKDNFEFRIEPRKAPILDAPKGDANIDVVVAA